MLGRVLKIIPPDLGPDDEVELQMKENPSIMEGGDFPGWKKEK